MRLKEQFKLHNYKSLLQGETAKSCQLDINYLMGKNNQVPSELYDIFISEYGDELFVILNGDSGDLSSLCDKWDRKLSIFAQFGSDNRKVLAKFKYNIIELLLCQDRNVNRSEEGSLKVTRKIILPYSPLADGELAIPDEDAVEIPFYMIPASDFSLDEEKLKRLKECMPDESIRILYRANKAGRGTNNTFELSDYERIEEWLKNVHSESEN